MPVPVVMENLGLAFRASAGAPPSTSRRFRRIRTSRSRGCTAATRRGLRRRSTSTALGCRTRALRRATRICSRPRTSTSCRSPRRIICTPARPSRPRRAGKHIVLEKPTGLDVEELCEIRDAVRERRASARSCRSSSGTTRSSSSRAGCGNRAGSATLRFARTQYLSNVTDWYPGWDWVRTRASGRSHLLAAGCHAVDALRWCAGPRGRRGQRVPHALHRRLRMADLNPRERQARRRRARPRDELDRFHAAVHLRRRADGGPRDAAAGSSPVARRARSISTTLRRRESISRTSRSHPRPTVLAARASESSARCRAPPTSAIIRSRRRWTNSSTAFAEGRDTSIDVFDAQKTMEVCLAADRSAEHGGRPVRAAASSRGNPHDRPPRRFAHRHRRRFRHRHGRWRVALAHDGYSRGARRPTGRAPEQIADRARRRITCPNAWPCRPTSPTRSLWRALFRQDEGGVWPARPALQQRRHQRARRAARRSDRRAVAARGRYEPERRVLLHAAGVQDDEAARTPRAAGSSTTDRSPPTCRGPRSAPYTATKHAITGLTRVDLARRPRARHRLRPDRHRQRVDRYDRADGEGRPAGATAAWPSSQ